MRGLRVAELATAQHGIVTRLQLVALGLGHDAIDDWIRRGRLHAVHRGVYAVGHRALHRRAAWLGAVLACGPGAVLSHRSAAALWDLRRTSMPRVEVCVPGGGGRRRRHGILLHRTRTLADADVTCHDGIAVTTVARTLVDLAEVVPGRSLERATDQAEVVRRFDLAALVAVIEAHPRRAGSARMRALLAEHAVGSTLTRTDLEDRVLALCARAELPRPAVNAVAAGLEVDFLWARERLVAEADSRRYHATRWAFERDRERDAQLLLHGYRVVRFTDRRIATRPAEIAGTLRALLAAPAGAHVAPSPPDRR